YDAVFPRQDFTGDVEAMCLYAGTGCSAIADIPSAGELVERLWRECSEEWLEEGGLGRGGGGAGEPHDPRSCAAVAQQPGSGGPRAWRPRGGAGASEPSNYSYELRLKPGWRLQMYYTLRTDMGPSGQSARLLATAVGADHQSGEVLGPSSALRRDA